MPKTYESRVCRTKTAEKIERQQNGSANLTSNDNKQSVWILSNRNGSMTNVIKGTNESATNEQMEKLKLMMTKHHENPHENLTVFTCLVDMIALEEGVFGSETSTGRIVRAHRNLQHGLKLRDGSIFRYSHTKGPSLEFLKNGG